MSNMWTVCSTLHTVLKQHTVHRADITCSEKLLQTYFKFTFSSTVSDDKRLVAVIIPLQVWFYVHFVHFYNGPIIKYTSDSL